MKAFRRILYYIYIGRILSSFLQIIFALIHEGLIFQPRLLQTVGFGSMTSPSFPPPPYEDAFCKFNRVQSAVPIDFSLTILPSIISRPQTEQQKPLTDHLWNWSRPIEINKGERTK